MKEKLFRMLRSGMALLLALCMVAGFLPSVAFSAENEVKPIKYVSLGDSMTNGLGLGGGYDSTGHMGYREIDKYSYPYYFQKHLAKLNGWNGENEETTLTEYAELTQLATSGMRAEDLHYILKAGTEDAFPCDAWAQSELMPRRWSDSDVASVFQSAVTNADVITMAVGNANFGVYMMDVISSTMDDGRYDINFDHCTLDNGLELLQLGAEAETLVRGAYAEVLEYLSAYISPELADTIANRISYVLASYLANYEAALDRIIELNPDAEIIIVGLMNTMSYFDMDITYQGETKHMDVADLLDILLNPLNMYLAAIPTVKQAQGNYAQAKFYYAELDRIETLSKTFKDVYQEEENLIRDRFVKDVVGGGDGKIWTLLKDTGATLENITLDDVVEYEAYVYGADGKNDETAQIQGLLAYNADETRAAKTASVVAYLAFENAVLDALEKTLYVNLDEVVIPEENSQGAMGIITANLGNALTETPIMSKAVQDNLEKVATVYVETVMAPSLPPMDDDQTAAALRGAIDAAMASDEVLALTTAYVMPTAMADDLNSDDLLSGLLCLYGRLNLADGMSAHPNRNDHVNMAAEVISAYGNHTAQDEVKEQTMITLINVYKLLKQYGPEIAASQPQAISSDLAMHDDFKYVAIGDGSAANQSYVKKLEAALNEDAAKNGVSAIEMVNYAKVDNTVAAERANLSDVSGADLITVGFSNVTFLSKTLKGEVEIDWAGCIGEENVHYVDELLAEVDASLTESGLDEGTKAYVTSLVEAYAYSAVEYACELPELINEIKEINPDALVVIVGMHNTMQGATIVLNEDTTLDISEYIDHLVDGVAAHGFAYAVTTGNAIYVDAREVETELTNAELTLFDLFKLAVGGFAGMYPTDNGHEYIKEQIWNALNLTYGLLGDVNDDGVVNVLDLMRLANHFAKGVEINEANADVNADGTINVLDLMRLANYFAGKATLG